MDSRDTEQNKMYWMIEDDQVETLIDAHVDTLTDLSISDLQAEWSNGGMLLPIVQACRQATSR